MGRTEDAGFRRKSYKTLQARARKTTTFQRKINGMDVVQGELSMALSDRASQIFRLCAEGEVLDRLTVEFAQGASASAWFHMKAVLTTSFQQSGGSGGGTRNINVTFQGSSMEKGEGRWSGS